MDDLERELIGEDDEPTGDEEVETERQENEAEPGDTGDQEGQDDDEAQETQEDDAPAEDEAEPDKDEQEQEADTPDGQKPTDDRKVPLAALQEERRRRQEESRKAAELQKQLDAVIHKDEPTKPQPKDDAEAQAPQQPKDAEEAEPEDDFDLSKLDDDDIVTAGQLRRLQQRQQAEARRNMEATIRNRMAESEAAAADRFGKDKVPDGLDYESVLTAGHRNLSAADIAAIGRAGDPGSLAYKLCIERTPTLRDRLLSHRQEAVRQPRAAAKKPMKPTVEDDDDNLPRLIDLMPDGSSSRELAALFEDGAD